MRDRSDKIPANKGVSPQDDVDVDALFVLLQDEVRGGNTADTDGRPAQRARVLWRGQAERTWSVSAERPIVRRHGVKGLAAYWVKRLLRPFLRWYVEPLAAEQRVFNHALLRVVDDLYESTDRALSANEAGERFSVELDERLTRVERRGATDSRPSAQTVAAQPAATAIPDYFAFEARMRGSTASVRERQASYLPDFLDCSPVLDVGCGRGELLGLLRDAGIEARGVDADADMVAYARGEGLDVEQADVVAYLERVEDGSLGGVFAGQLVEHLPPPALLRLLELVAVKLRSGGLLVAETINPLSPLALRSYFADLTHAQPLVPETLALLARQAGFRQVETRFLNEPDEKLAIPDDPVLAENARRLNDLLFGPLDYAILART